MNNVNIEAQKSNSRYSSIFICYVNLLLKIRLTKLRQCRFISTPRLPFSKFEEKPLPPHIIPPPAIKHSSICVLYASGIDNDTDNPNDIISGISNIKLRGSLTLLDLTYYLFRLIQTEIMMQKGINPKDIIYQIMA